MVYALHEIANQTQVTEYFRVEGLPTQQYNPIVAVAKSAVVPKPRLGTKVLRTSDTNGVRNVVKRCPEDVAAKPLKRSRILDMPQFKFKRNPSRINTIAKQSDAASGPVRVSHEMFPEEVVVKSRPRVGIATNPYIRRRYSADLTTFNSVCSFNDSQRLSQYSNAEKSSMSTSTSMTSTKSSSSYSFQQNKRALQVFQGLRRSARKTLASVQKAVRRSIDLADIKQATQKFKQSYGRVVELHRPDVNIPFGLFISKINNNAPSNFIVTRLTMLHNTGLSLGDEILEINDVKSTELTLANVKDEMYMKRHLKLLVAR